MAINEHTNNRMQKHWDETSAFIVSSWPKFTDVELDRINGDFDTFLKYLWEYYGGFPQTEALARAKLNRFFNEMDEKFPNRE